MAGLGAQTLCSMKTTLGGVGSLPDARKFSSNFVPSTSGNWLRCRNLKRRTAVALSKASRTTIHSQQNDSQELKSIAESERRANVEGAAALDSIDAVDITRVVLEAAQLPNLSTKGRSPPRFATLRSFGEAGGDAVMTGQFEGTSVFELIAANIEASKQVKNWEVFSGRLAMLALSTSLGVEILTGNSVFSGIDVQKLEAVAALCAVAFVSAGGFAYAWRAKADVVTLMSKGYKNMVESAVDNLIEGLFFDET